MSAEKTAWIAGAASVEITPLDVRQTYLAGFGPNRKANGVLDPLFARALYLSNGQTETVIVALDLIGLPYPDAMAIRKSIEVVPAENIFICCTHTHEGPDTMGLWGPAIGSGLPLVPGKDPTYLKMLADRVVHAVRRAKARSVPAKIAMAEDRTEKEFTWNIRRRGLLDHALSLLRVDRAKDGKNIAVLTNYASHPETLWFENKKISADFPLAIHNRLERKFGGVSIFINGALGAMVTPGIDEDAPLSVRESFYTAYGSKIAAIAENLAESAQYIDDARLEVENREVMLPLDNRRFKLASWLGLIERELEDERVRTTVGYLRIGPAQVVGFPGETEPGLGLACKELLSGAPRFFFGLCNDEIGYILQASDFGTNLYKYETSMSLSADSAGILMKTLREMVRN